MSRLARDLAVEHSVSTFAPCCGDCDDCTVTDPCCEVCVRAEVAPCSGSCDYCYDPVCVVEQSTVENGCELFHEACWEDVVAEGVRA